MRRMRPEPHRARGFTLVEMVVVIAISGILLAIVALFVRRPMEGIIDSTRRVALADAADGALRRMGREIRQALPNSLRTTYANGNWYIEFLPVLAAGRYCEQSDCGSSPFKVAESISSLSYAGPALTLNPLPAGTELVIYNLGISGANAWSGDNTAALSALGAGNLVFAPRRFPYESPGKRFQLIGRPVSYFCVPGEGLIRVAGYARQAIQPTVVPGGASTALLSNQLAGCSVDYAQSAIDQKGLLTLTLTLADHDDRLTLTHAIQVTNTP